jgi:hypothetical protein
MKNRKIKQVLSQGWYQWGRGRRLQRKDAGGQIWWKYCALMYENGKMRPAGTILRMGDGDKRERWRR